ncbi:MAG: hypothetical protein ACC661_04900, partial [Verrucomicrobiales bacterium]
MRHDSEAALEQALTLDEWLALPAAMKLLVEEPFSERVDIDVVPQCSVGSSNAALPIGGGQDDVSTRMQDGAQLRTYVYGRREGMLSRKAAPAQGIRLDDQAVLRERLFQPLTESELTAATALYPLANPDPARDFGTGDLLGDEPVTALAGGRLFLFTDEAALDAFEARANQLEEMPGPDGGARVIFQMLDEGEAFTGSAEFDWEGAQLLAQGALT